MVEYLELIDHVLTHGKPRQSQKPEPTIMVDGYHCQYDASKTFPLITTRNMNWNWSNIVIPELLWIMSGSTNVKDLHKYNDSSVWDKWAVAAHDKLGYQDGELGPTYGHQLRSFAGHVDQLTQVIDMLKRDQNTRRAVISYWNLGDVEEPDGTHVVDVACCPFVIGFLQVGGKLDMNLVHRSADIMVGVPNDIAGYGALHRLVCKEVDLPPGIINNFLFDAHIYLNQIPAAKELLKRNPLPGPEIIIHDSSTGTIYDHKVADFELVNYQHHPSIKNIPVAL